jgi:hypothetical protein
MFFSENIFLYKKKFSFIFPPKKSRSNFAITIHDFLISSAAIHSTKKKMILNSVQIVAFVWRKMKLQLAISLDVS